MNKNTEAPLWVGADRMKQAVTVAEAIEVLEYTLQEGFDPELDGERTRKISPYGWLLQMPSASASWCGTKLLTLRTAGSDSGLPAIQGLYVLFEGRSLAPVSVMEGAGLTTLRTPAMTALAIKYLAGTSSGRVVIFGAGIQAEAHVDAIMAVFQATAIDIVGGDSERAQKLSDEINARGISSSVVGSESVATADAIVCCTTSREPLFDGSLVQDHAVVAAIGAHEPESREVDTTLVQRSTAVVESKSSATREVGDLLIPHEEGQFELEDAVPIQDVILGHVSLDFTKPRLFTGTGMPWQDLVVAAKIYQATLEAD